MVIISQYVKISSHHIFHLKGKQCFVNCYLNKHCGNKEVRKQLLLGVNTAAAAAASEKQIQQGFPRR